MSKTDCFGIAVSVFFLAFLLGHITGLRANNSYIENPPNLHTEMLDEEESAVLGCSNYDKTPNIIPVLSADHTILAVRCGSQEELEAVIKNLTSNLR